MNGHDPEKNQSSKDPMLEKSRALFEQASEHLDSATSNRLRLMRRDALAGARRRMPYRWLPIGVAAAAVFGVALTWWLPQRGVDTPSETSLTSNEADLLPEDDTEMYAWLGEAPVATNDGQAGAQ